MEESTPHTAWGWVYRMTEKLGFPIALIMLAWFRLLEPATQRHFAEMDSERQAREALVKLAETQASLLLAIKQDSGETVAWTRSQAVSTRELLKEVKDRDGMN